jgi:hypothetical protein
LPITRVKPGKKVSSSEEFGIDFAHVVKGINKILLEQRKTESEYSPVGPLVAILT